MLDYTQIKNGKFRKREEKVDIRESVQIALDIVRLAMSEKGLSLVFTCNPNVPKELMVDHQRIN